MAPMVNVGGICVGISNVISQPSLSAKKFIKAQLSSCSGDDDVAAAAAAAAHL